MNGVNRPGTRIRENGDEHVLLDIERSRIQRELPPLPFKKNPVRYMGRHQTAQWDHRDLGRDCRDGKRLGPVPEELVKEWQERAGENPEDPHSECEHGKGRVIGSGHGQGHLLDRRVFLLLFLLLLRVVQFVDFLWGGRRGGLVGFVVILWYCRGTMEKNRVSSFCFWCNGSFGRTYLEGNWFQLWVLLPYPLLSLWTDWAGLVGGGIYIKM